MINKIIGYFKSVVPDEVNNKFELASYLNNMINKLNEVVNSTNGIISAQNINNTNIQAAKRLVAELEDLKADKDAMSQGFDSVNERITHILNNFTDFSPSDVEIVDAREGQPTLRDNIQGIKSQLAENIKQVNKNFKIANNHFGLCQNTIQLDQNLINKLKNDGYKIIRMSIHWYGVETTKGVYNLSIAEQQFNMIKNAGMKPHIILFGGNTLYGTNNLSITREEGLVGWSNFVRAVVAKFKNNNVQWEIWNEPWNESFWNPFTVFSGEDYGKLVNRTYPIIKELDSSSEVVGTSIINFDLRLSDWYEPACKVGMLNNLDKVSVHYYSEDATYPEKDIQSFYDKIRNINNKYLKNNIPLTITETGYTTATNSTKTVLETDRSTYLPRVILLNMLNGIDETVIYEAKSSHTTSTDREQWFGILNSDNSNTETYNSIIKLINELTDFSFVKRLRTLESDYVLEFVDKENNFKYVFWTISEPHYISVEGRNVLITGSVEYLTSNDKLGFSDNTELIEIKSNLRKINEFLSISKKYNEILQTTKCDFLFNTSTEPWFPTSLAGGTVSTAVEPKHPGIHTYLSHATNPNSGYLYRVGASSFILNGNEKSTIIFKTPSDFTNVIRRSGFFYSADSTEPTNGVYFEQNGNIIVGKSSNVGSKTITSSSFTMSVNTWHRGVIRVGDNAKFVRFELYKDDSDEILWSDTITSNIPSVSNGGNAVGHEDICIATTSTSARVIGSIDYFDIYTPNSRKLI